jgi:hypothetical protein
MSQKEDIESRIKKLETKAGIKFYLEVVILPIVLAILGFYINRTLKESELKQSRYQLSSDLIEMVLDTSDSKKTYLSYQLMSKVDNEFGNEIKPNLINWKLESILGYINNKNINKANLELTIAHEMGGVVGKEIYRIFSDSIKNGKSKKYKEANELYLAILDNTTSEVIATSVGNVKNEEQNIVNPGSNEKIISIITSDDVIQSKQSKQAVDKLMGSNVVTQKVPLKKELQSSSEPHVRTGWLFLGTFNTSNKESIEWITYYLKGITNYKPEDLVNKSFTIKEGSSSYIRTGKPTSYAEFLPVIHVAKSGERILIKKVEPWSTTGYMWAEVEY